ncbi:hypothetical protein ACFQY9_06730 [Microvirga aerilata]|uniref:hypothetical protein n=1 Tax=Microvirga aerilata TaxID=670292 RepID=UPI00362DA9DC
MYEARRHFGYRALNEVLAFCQIVPDDAPDTALNAALDHAIFAKILTKVRGDDTGQLGAALASVAGICERENLPVSLRKVKAMSQALEATGAARFWA